MFNTHSVTNDSNAASRPTFQRPYRSKRSRPCDSCRRRKTACRIESQPPCISCTDLRIECRFEGPPIGKKRKYPPLDDQNATLPPSERDSSQHQNRNESAMPDVTGTIMPDVTTPSVAQNLIWETDDSLNYHLSMADYADEPPQLAFWPMMTPGVTAHSGYYQEGDISLQDSSAEDALMDAVNIMASSSNYTTPPSTVIRSLEEMKGYTAQYFGLSGETDPYLIRHFSFATEGEARFFKVHFRKVANEGKEFVPAQFMISSNELGDTMKRETSLFSDSSMAAELDKIIQPNDRRLLLKLFLRFVFPNLPIISRSRLGITQENQEPDLGALSKMPCHLLAAIYAISLQFCHYDPELCVRNVYKAPEADRLWQIALQEIMREIHTPRLSVLQAILLYLQKPQSEEADAMADSPFRWSFVGFANSLASTLGLHLECRPWSIPDWEKRLRRRLSWAVFSEVAWRSLFMGFPNPIHVDDWDVGELCDEDFIFDPPQQQDVSSNSATTPENTHTITTPYDFIHLTRLAVIASGIHSKLYTVKASQKLAVDLDLSVETAQPLRDELSGWYSSLPDERKILYKENTPKSIHRQRYGGAAYLQIAYLTLELLIHRALLRPAGILVPKEPSDASKSQQYESTSSQEFDSQVHASLDSILDSAEECAGLMITWTEDLSSTDRSCFWFSWSRICFSTMSNFAIMLLIQAPSTTRAQRAKEIADEWRDVLRSHSKTFSLVKLGLLRLNSMHYVGLKRLSRSSQWAEKLISNKEAD